MPSSKQKIPVLLALGKNLGTLIELAIKNFYMEPFIKIKLIGQSHFGRYFGYLLFIMVPLDCIWDRFIIGHFTL